MDICPFVPDEPVEGVEERRIITPYAIDFRNPQQGRHVIALEIQGFLVVSKGGRILVFGNGMVPELGEDERGRIFLVIFLQGLQCLVWLVLAEQDVVSGGSHLFVFPEYRFDLVHRRESLVVLVVLEIQVDKVEMEVVFLREFLQQVFVGCYREIVFT